MRRDLMMPPGFDFDAAQAARDARTHVYFVEGVGLIKIGHAVSPVDRFFGMLTGCPVPLSLLASMPGGPTMETRLHSRFAASRSHGEWFYRTADLDALIADAPYQYGTEYRSRVAMLKTRRTFSTVRNERRNRTLDVEAP